VQRALRQQENQDIRSLLQNTVKKLPSAGISVRALPGKAQILLHTEGTLQTLHMGGPMKINRFMLIVIITGLLVIALEMKEMNRRLGDIKTTLYDISLEMSLVTAAGTNLGVIGERVTVNGDLK
jgi:hypothetical protein